MSVEAWRVRRSMGRCWGFMLLSFGIYGPYWVYVTRTLLDTEMRQGRDDAAFHTVGSFIPILHYFVAYWIWRDIDRLRRSVGLPPFEVGLFVGLTVFGGAPVTYSLVLNKLNEYWDMRSQGWATDAPTTTGEKVVVAAGAALWLAFVGAFFLVLILALAAS